MTICSSHTVHSFCDCLLTLLARASQISDPEHLLVFGHLTDCCVKLAHASLLSEWARSKSILGLRTCQCSQALLSHSPSILCNTNPIYCITNEDLLQNQNSVIPLPNIMGLQL